MQNDYKSVQRTYLSRSWAEVDLDAIKHNIKEIKASLRKKTEIMGVVKADAYGHGVLEVARTLIESGVTRLAVSMLDEAIQLRKCGITVPILILSYTDPARAGEIIEYNVTQTIYSHDLAKSLSAEAVKRNTAIKVHVKIDTGMSRVGFCLGYQAVKDVMIINELPGIIIEGIFTHFSKADETDKEYTLLQFDRFINFCAELERIGILIPIKHVANSAAVMSYPEMQLDMVRPGIIQYGLYPSKEVDQTALNLKPAMSLKSNVIMVKSVEKDTLISYGGIFKTQRDSVIATLPIGYADGYSRLLSNKSRVLINGEYAPVVGRICMDQCMADVTDIVKKGIDVKVGDETVIFGTQLDSAGIEHSISIDELADIIGTINYELICIIGKRIPRIYLRNGKICDVLNYLLG